MNYEVCYIDYIQCGINETELEADNINVFGKFSYAKKELIRRAVSNRNEVAERVNEIRLLTKNDFGVK